MLKELVHVVNVNMTNKLANGSYKAICCQELCVHMPWRSGCVCARSGFPVGYLLAFAGFYCLSLAAKELFKPHLLIQAAGQLSSGWAVYIA